MAEKNECLSSLQNMNILTFHLSREKQLLNKELKYLFKDWPAWKKHDLIFCCLDSCSQKLFETLFSILQPLFKRAYKITLNGQYSFLLTKNFCSAMADCLSEKVGILSDQINNINWPSKVNLRHDHSKKTSVLKRNQQYLEENVSRLCHQINTTKSPHSTYQPTIKDHHLSERVSRHDILQSFTIWKRSLLEALRKWDDSQKGCFILSLASAFTIEDVIYIANLLRKKLSEPNHISSLQDNTILKIFSYLKPCDLVMTSQVSKDWREKSNSFKKLWKHRCYVIATKFNQASILSCIKDLELDWKSIHNDLILSIPQQDDLENSQTNTINFLRRLSCPRNNAIAGNTLNKEEEFSTIPNAENKRVAYDVRPKLIQAINQMRTSNVAFKGDLTIEEELAQVSITGVISLKRVRELKGHSDAVNWVQFDAKRVVSGSCDMKVMLWDLRSGSNFQVLNNHQGGIYCLQFDENYIVTGSWDRAVRIWDVVNFVLLDVLNSHKDCVSCLMMNDQILVTGSHDTNVCIFEKDTWKLLAVLDVHTAPVSSVYIVNEDNLLTSSHDGSVILWDLIEFEMLRVFRSEESPVLCVRCCGNLVTAGTYSGMIAFWDYNTGRLEGVIKAHYGGVHSIAFNATRFFTGGGDGVIKEWDLPTCVCLRSFTGHTGPVLCVRASHKRIVSASKDGTVRIWDLICNTQQVGGIYDELNKINVEMKVVDELEYKRLRVSQ